MVRLRISNGLKRIFKVNPELVYFKINELLGWVSDIKQASTQWTLAQLFLTLEGKLTNSERKSNSNYANKPY